MLKYFAHQRKMLLAAVEDPGGEPKLSVLVQDGLDIDRDLEKDLISSQLMRLVAKQGEVQAEWDAL